MGKENILMCAKKFQLRLSQLSDCECSSDNGQLFFQHLATGRSVLEH